MTVNSNDTTAKKKHKWRFFQAGGFDQVQLISAEDLANIDQLDQKLWVALACPIRGLEFDDRTLAIIDSETDGRIRAPELIAATKWACNILKNPADLALRAPALPLSAINDSTEEGRAILASARQVLEYLGKPEAETITIEEVADTSNIFCKTLFNGDDIIPAEAAQDEVVQNLILDIISCMGSELDRSGLPGISRKQFNNFFTSARAYSDWWKRAEDESAAIFVLGEHTQTAITALRVVRDKIEDYFTRCNLAAFDPRAAIPLSRGPDAYEAMAAKTLAASVEAVMSLPLAMVEAGRPLPLFEGINPGWSAAIEEFRKTAVIPIIGARQTLSEPEWKDISTQLSPYEAWEKAKEGSEVEKLGISRVRKILTSDVSAIVEELLDRDLALAPHAAAIAEVEKLIRLYRDLFTLLNNFVSFRDFYSRKEKAIFQAGTLFIDGRSCDLCIRVADVAKHSAMATEGRIFLAYCDCIRRGGTDKISIAAAFTNGDAGFLYPGKNGIFFDRKGQDWDATIVKVIDHPISIRQAFWAPYRQTGKLVIDQIQKFATAKEKAVLDKAVSGVYELGSQADAIKPAPVAPQASPAFDVAKFAGIFAAIGLALGAIGSALASVVTGFIKLAWWQMPLALCGIILAISGPSMLLAYLNLKDRNMGPLLDACGWAVNTRAKINIPFGASLTSIAKLPLGTERLLADPFAEKKRPWRLYAIIAAIIGILIILWRTGLLGKCVGAK